jgi:hypothetical protein
VNLNSKRFMDIDRCPPIIRSEYVVHVPFKRAIIKYALDNFPNEYNSRVPGISGPRYYPNSVYEALGLNVPPTPKVTPLLPPPAPRISPPPSGNFFSGLLSGSAPPPSPLFGLRDLAGLGGPPQKTPSDLPNLFWLEDLLK